MKSLHYKLLKSVLFFIGIVVIAILGFIATFPIIISTQKGKDFFIHQINDHIPGKISIDSAYIHWLRGQTLNQIKLWDPNGNLVLEVEKFSTELSLLSLLLKKYHLGKTELLSPYIHLITNEDGTTNLDEALGSKTKEKTESKQNFSKNYLFDGNITIKNGQALLEMPHVEAVEFQDMQIEIHFPQSQSEKVFHAQGITHQGLLYGKFLISGVANFQEDSFDPFALKDQENIHLLIQMDNLPTAGLDQILKQNFLKNVIGPDISAKADIRIHPNQTSLSCEIKSKNLQGNFFGYSKDGILLVSQPSLLNFQLQPEIANRFLKENSLNITAPINFTFNLEELLFPLSSTSWKDIGFKSNFTVSSLEINNETHLDTINGSINAESIGHLIEMKYSGNSLNNASIKGSFQFREFSYLQYEGSFRDFSPSIFKLPDLIGEKANIDFQGFSKKDGTFLEMNLHTSLLEANKLKFYITDQIQLIEPASIKYLILPHFFDSYGIKQKASVSLLIKHFKTSKNDPFNPSLISIECSYNSTPLHFSDIIVHNLNGKVQADSLSNSKISSHAAIHFNDRQPQLLQNLNLNLDFNLSIKKTTEDLWQTFIPNLNAQLNSDYLSCVLNGAIDADKHFILKRPSRVDFIITPDLLYQLTKKPSSEIIKEPFKGSLTVNSLSLPLNPFDLRKMRIDGSGEIPSLFLKDSSSQAEAAFNNIQMDFHIDASKNNATFHLNADSNITYLGTSPLTYQGKIRASTDVKNFVRSQTFQWLKAIYYFDVIVDEFPTPIIDAFAEQNGVFTALLGPSLKLTLSSHYAPEKEEEGLLEIFASSQGFNAALAIEINDVLRIHRTKPSFIQWDLTPLRYQFLQQMIRNASSSAKTDFILLDPSRVNITITELTCPTNPIDKVSSFLCQSGLVANIKVTPMHLRNQLSQERVDLQDLHVNINGKNFTDKIHVDFGGDLKSYQQNATFSFIGDLQNAWTTTGRFNREHLSASGILSLNQLSVNAMTGIIPMEPETRSQLRALLGQQVNAKISLQISELSGPIMIDIDSTNFKANIPAQLGNGSLTLRDQVTAEINLNEELSSTLLKNVSPLLISAKSATPIRLFIEPEGFIIPVKPFILRGVHIEKAVLDLGKFRVQNGGNLQSLMDFLKAKGISEEGEMDAWFTPIFMSLNDGVATYKRFDALLANNVHIASWGRIDLNKNKVNMILAISPETMRSAFGITGLPEEYMFQIKMKGPAENVAIDWKSASTRIGMLIARTAGGSAGLLIGKLFDLIRNVLGDQKTPPPTNYPFPWSKDAPERAEDIPVITPPPQKKPKNPVERIFKSIIPFSQD